MHMQAESILSSERESHWGWQSKEAAERNKDIVFAQERPKGATPVPEGLDWDLWLGPAPERPFNNVYFPGPKWYRWWEWGSGTMRILAATSTICRSGH